MHLAGPVVLLLVSACSLPAVAASAAPAAKDYPVRPVRLVIPQTAGSSTDTMTRVLAAKMSELLGQQVVIDNRTGVGASSAVRSWRSPIRTVTRSCARPRRHG